MILDMGLEQLDQKVKAAFEEFSSGMPYKAKVEDFYLRNTPGVSGVEPRDWDDNIWSEYGRAVDQMQANATVRLGPNVKRDIRFKSSQYTRLRKTEGLKFPKRYRSVPNEVADTEGVAFRAELKTDGDHNLAVMWLSGGNKDSYKLQVATDDEEYARRHGRNPDSSVCFQWKGLPKFEILPLALFR